MGLLGKVTEAGTAIIGEVSAIAAGKKIPKKVKTLKNITISIVTLGTRYKIARASTGQETIPEIISDVKTQNLNLITKIIADNDLGLPTTILEWESDNESNNSTPSSDVNISSIPDNNVPFDGRLVYLVDDKSGNVLMSLQANVEKEMVDGFVIPKKDDPANLVLANNEKGTESLSAFYGVPSIMNSNAYINLQAAGGKGKNQNLVDRENQPRFYDDKNPKVANSNLGASKTPTTTNIIEWSNLEENRFKFPYKYQDFVYCKWWQKIPNNYMITLRRYPYPVIDNVTSGEEAKGQVNPITLVPTATMVTYLGEDSGNKISELVGGIEAGLNWKTIKADVWEVTKSGTPASVNNPAPSISKFLGFLTSGAAGAKDRVPGAIPPDPYSNGPYANKILGPVTVITETKGRDRGVTFKHEMSVVFEYSFRSIGGINTKAAALDIISNALVMTYGSAPFWGGMNRMMPGGAQGDLDPFLGGDAGRKAWINGDPKGFFNAVKTQFQSIAQNIGDLFNKLFDDPIGGLKDIAMKGAGEFMKLNVTDGNVQVQGMHSLLTGLPVGEWHLQIGSPFNPIMMIGNLVCTGVKIDFSDELGPDDFPTEAKITISLEHGMPRDRDAIESMFNAGSGRMYSLPKGYKNSSEYVTNVDNAARTQSLSSTQAGRGGDGSRKTIVRGRVSDRAQRPEVVGFDRAYDQLYSYPKMSNQARVRSANVSLYSMGTDDEVQNSSNTTQQKKNRTRG
jgi:hypothetical protein